MVTNSQIREDNALNAMWDAYQRTRSVGVENTQKTLTGSEQPLRFFILVFRVHCLEYGAGVDQRIFTGLEYDDDTDLTYAKARYLDQDIGKWLSQDPAVRNLGIDPRTAIILRDPQLSNSYSYARNNPLILTDGNGEFVEVSGSLVVPGRTFSLGVRFDGSGIDGFFGGGVGVGLSGGLNIAWAPGVSLSHRREGSITANGTAAYYAGGRLSQDLLTYYPNTKTSVTFKRPVLALTLGLGLSASVEEQLSAPLYVWGSGSSANLRTPNQSYYTPMSLSPNSQSSYPSLTSSGFSSAQSSAATSVANSFGFSSLSSSQTKAIQSVKEAFSK